MKGNQSVRIPIGICKDIDTEMLSLRKFFPKEFARLLRPLNIEKPQNFGISYFLQVP